MKKNVMKRKKLILLAVHLYMFLSTLIITIMGVTAGAGAGQDGDKMKGLGYFRAFTMDSNILAGLVSLAIAVMIAINIYKKQEKMPYTLVLLQSIAATAVGLTFVVAATFLAPKQILAGESYFVTFSGDMFFFHFLNPLLAIGAFILGDKDYLFGSKEILFGLIPPMIYSVVYACCVVYAKVWEDFYGFTFGGKTYTIVPVSLVIYMISYLIGLLLIKLKNFGKTIKSFRK